jgi:curved DNA-binding protein CbpA
MSLLYHPDKTRVMESSELFQIIKKAYEVLSDEQARASYDHRTKGKVFTEEYTDIPVKETPKKQSIPKATPPSNSGDNKPKADDRSSQSYSTSNKKNENSYKLPAPFSLRVVAVDTTSVTLAWKIRESETPGVTFELQTKLVTQA